MDLLPTGYKNLLIIESDKFDLYISGKIHNLKSDILNLNQNQEAGLFVRAQEDINVIVKTSDRFGNLGINYGYKMMPSFFDNQIYQLYLNKKGNRDIEIYHLDDEIRNSLQTYGDVIVGNFNFINEVGYTTFKIRENSAVLLSLTIEVFPSKMDYKEDYMAMMDEINEEISALAFDFLGTTFHMATLKDTDLQSGVEFISILETIYNKFEDSLKRIENSPKHAIIQEEKVVNPWMVKRPSKNNINFFRSHPKLLYKDNKGFIEINGVNYYPIKAIELEKKTSLDIFENRYVKYILMRLKKKIVKIKNNIIIEYNKENEYYKVLEKIEKKIDGHLKSFFKDIGDLKNPYSTTLVFQMAPGYREIYKYYMILNKGLTLGDDLYSISPKKIWKLYEIWCYLKIDKIIKELGYKVTDYGIIAPTNDGLTFNLLQDKTSKIEYINEEGEILELWYNKSYQNLPTTEQKPDTVLCLNKKGERDRMYIFDAKYRIDVKDGIAGPLEEDINEMHRYRDAIVAEMKDDFEYRFETFGAYIMFPYADEKKFTNHKYYKSIDKVNIGAFPILPGTYELMRNHIESILFESEIESKERVIRHVVDDDSRFKYKNVLVANTKDKRHLEAYVKNNFYHIPLKYMSTVRPGIEYIAFYQSIRMFGDEAGINYYGKIKKMRLYKRSQCKELIKKSDEMYIRFELEYVKKIGPIKPVEYGIELFIYTTKYLLDNAETVHELSLKNRNEVELYRILKNIKKEGHIVKRMANYFEVDGIKVEVLNKNTFRIDGRLYDTTFDEIGYILRNLST
ncbi:hypothetical protein EDD65_1032 [Keratinibaculum paraultunense]|uniref:DUF2357 domain-containing protein n=1 Tax=Keratinibaculum paraultunense TaxID=1278232 RepID=A0A4R3L2F7_9FIRM|nr:restriction endonuclease-like protein [Keratinibaculum paraultunense]QQY80194.1 restriction endonuclease-like protein [Keratinibaculum paraultunense]TCS90705.1 hypothetical protein EDD65_1032 [Keratinibaculum paraultunense]